MKEKYFSEKMIDKSDADLKYYIENEKIFQEEAIMAAKLELNKRGLYSGIQKPESTEVITSPEYPERYETSESNKQIHMPDEHQASYEFRGYPPKPQEEIKKHSINRSLMSLGLFIGVFYMFFNWDISSILVLTGVIIIHELGHFLAMRIFKYNDLGIFFVPLVGAFASGSKDTISQKQNIIILLAGPLPGIIIGLILYYYGLREDSAFLLSTSNIFLFINIFNLLPVMPLDGGRLIKSLFFENNEIITKVFTFISIAALGYYSLVSQSYFLLIVPFVLLIQLSSQSEIKKVKQGIKKLSIHMNKSYAELTDEEYWLIRDEIGTHMKTFSRFITPKHYVLTGSEQRVVSLIKTIIQKRPTKDLKVWGKIFITLLWVLTFIAPIIVIAIYYIRLGIEIQ